MNQLSWVLLLGVALLLLGVLCIIAWTTARRLSRLQVLIEYTLLRELRYAFNQQRMWVDQLVEDHGALVDDVRSLRVALGVDEDTSTLTELSDLQKTTVESLSEIASSLDCLSRDLGQLTGMVAHISLRR